MLKSLEITGTRRFNDFVTFKPMYLSSEDKKETENQRKVRPIVETFENEEYKIKGVSLEVIANDHSIQGAQASIWKTSVGNMLFTGDIRDHGVKQDCWKNLINRSKEVGIDIMIMEGTNILEKYPKVRKSKGVMQKMIQYAKKADKDKLIMGIYPIKDYADLDNFYITAKNTNRDMTISLKQAHSLLLNYIKNHTNESKLIKGKKCKYSESELIDETGRFLADEKVVKPKVKKPKLPTKKLQKEDESAYNEALEEYENDLVEYDTAYKEYEEKQLVIDEATRKLDEVIDEFLPKDIKIYAQAKGEHKILDSKFAIEDWLKEYFIWERRFLVKKAIDKGIPKYVKRINVIHALDIKTHQGAYLHCGTDDYDLKQLNMLKPKEGSLLIRSKTDPFCEDMELDLQVIMNWVDRYKLNYELVHVSGHAYGPSLAKLVTEINPKIVIPTHTQHAEAFEGILRNFGYEGRIICPTKNMIEECNKRDENDKPTGTIESFVFEKDESNVIVKMVEKKSR